MSGNGNVLVAGSDHAFRWPKSVRWEPQADITAHELALAMVVLLSMVSRGGGFISYPEDQIAILPPNVQRHFKIG